MLALAGAAGALVLVNRRLRRSGGLPENDLGGEARRYGWKGGDLAYSVAGEGEPLLLVHGVYAGASSFEFRKNFEELSRSFRVYALDLLGCGGSDRPRRRYEPEDVTAQIEDFVREEIGAPAHLIASSLSATLAMPAAVRNPHLFKRLVLICPTGYGTLDRASGLLGGGIQALFLAPIIGDTLYHAIVSKRGIRYYLQRIAYHDPSFVTDELIESYHRAAHAPGAKYFPAAFVSGKLNLGAAEFWPRVPQRAMICWGKEATITPVYQAGVFVQRNPRSEPRVFRDTALLPHDERARDFNREARNFLQSSSR